MVRKEIVYSPKNLRFYYYRFKDSPYYLLSIIGVSLVVSIYLILTFLIPQVSDWFSIRDEVIATSERIRIVQHNIAFLNSLDKDTLQTQLQTSVAALPSEKDFGAVLSVLSDSAAQSHVELNDYSFQVGNVGSSSAKVANQPIGATGLQLTVSITGPLTGVKDFLNAVSQKLPLSEIVQVQNTGDTTVIDLQFYEKPFPPIVYNDEEEIVPLSVEKVALLQKLSSWKLYSGGQTALPPVGSASAIPLF